MKTQGRTWIEGDHARSSVMTWVPIPAERVFAYVSDFSRHHEWAQNEITITPISSGPMRSGSRFKSVGRQGGKDWPADLEVTAYEPPHKFEFTATGGPLDAPIGDPHRHEFLIKQEGGGTSLELRRSDPKPPQWSPVVWRLIGGLVLRATLGRRVDTVNAIRRQLERQS